MTHLKQPGQIHSVRLRSRNGNLQRPCSAIFLRYPERSRESCFSWQEVCSKTAGMQPWHSFPSCFSRRTAPPGNTKNQNRQALPLTILPDLFVPFLIFDDWTHAVSCGTIRADTEQNDGSSPYRSNRMKTTNLPDQPVSDYHLLARLFFRLLPYQILLIVINAASACSLTATPRRT